MTVFISFLRAWFGEEEYQDAWHKRPQTWNFLLRFWGRLVLASAGLCFFLWLQIIEPSQWWGSDTFATLLLVLTASQAAGPLAYLLFKVTERVFLTKRYLETLSEGKFYVTVRSALCIVLMAVLSVIAVYGYLGTRWYIKPLVFFLTVPVALFWLFLPALNWAVMRVRGLTHQVQKR